MAKQLENPAEANGELGSNSHPAGSAELLRGGAGVTTEEESNLTREGQAADEDGVIPLEGKSFDWGSRRATLFSKSILKLLLLLAGLGVLMSSRYIGRTLVKTRFAFSPKSKREEVLVSAPVMPSVTMDDLVECEEQLISSFSGFVNTWRTASPVVQSAFKKYFVPSREDDPMPPPDPPALYDKHINAMLGVPRPNAEDVKAVQEHKLNLLLLNGVCGAASITIRKLMELEELHAETGVPVPMLGLGKPIDQEQLKGIMMQEKEGVTTAELLRKLGIVVKAEGETMSGLDVLKKYANDLIRENKLMRSRIAETKDQFLPFLMFQEPGGLQYLSDEHPQLRIIYSGEQFDVHRFTIETEFSQFLLLYELVTSAFPEKESAAQSSKQIWDFVFKQQSHINHFARRELEGKRKYLKLHKFTQTRLDESLEAIVRFIT